MEKFDLSQEEALTSLKKAVDNRMLKLVDKSNKNSHRIVQGTNLDEDCVIDSQIGETMENTDAVKDLSIRLDKTFYDSLTNLASEFTLFEAEMQQQLQEQVYRNISERVRKTNIYQKALLILTQVYYHSGWSMQYKMGW